MKIRLNASIGRCKEAFADFELAISVELNHAFTHIRKAEVLMMVGWESEEIEAYKKKMLAE